MQEKIEQQILLINSFINAINDFDTKTLENIIDEKLEFKNISHGEVIETTNSFLEFVLVLEQSKALFSKRIFQIENLNFNATNIEALVFCSATMAISTIDGLKAGQEINFKGSFSFIINENKINKIIQIS